MLRQSTAVSKKHTHTQEAFTKDKRRRDAFIRHFGHEPHFGQQMSRVQETKELDWFVAYKPEQEFCHVPPIKYKPKCPPRFHILNLQPTKEACQGLADSINLWLKTREPKKGIKS